MGFFLGELCCSREKDLLAQLCLYAFFWGGMDVVTTDKSFSEIQFGGYQTLVFHVALCSTLMIYLKTVFEA